MAITAQLLGLAGSAAEKTKELPMDPPVYGLIALLVFASLLGLTWTFRGSANKHR